MHTVATSISFVWSSLRSLSEPAILYSRKCLMETHRWLYLLVIAVGSEQVKTIHVDYHVDWFELDVVANGPQSLQAKLTG